MEQVWKIVLKETKTTEENVKDLCKELLLAGNKAENSTQNDEKIRCITIQGEGESFLTGMPDSETYETYRQVLDQNKLPIIVAVNGFCEGIGLDLLKRADLAVASKDAKIQGYEEVWDAAQAYEVNEVTEADTLFSLLEEYTMRLLAIPEPLITYGHKIYYAMEKLPDKLARSKYGQTVIDEIMTIQAELNQKLRKETGEQDPYSGVKPDEEISYQRFYDKDHAILFEIRDDVEYIQLNAPKYRNMMDWRTSMELAGAYALANAIPTLKAIVVTGTGKRFHLGGIRHDQDSEYEQERFADQLRIRNQIMREIKVPMIAAVNGECSGGGMSLVLKAQHVIAAESALFGYPEVKHNGFACNSMVNTMGVIPKKAALKGFYFGDLFSAKQAQQFGFVQEVVPDAELEQAVAAYVATL